jgi:hypothetical protein
MPVHGKNTLRRMGKSITVIRNPNKPPGKYLKSTKVNGRVVVCEETCIDSVWYAY